MNALWRRISHAFNSRAERERVVLLVAFLAVVYLLWWLILLAPVSNRIDALQTQTRTLDTQLTALQAQEQLLRKTASKDPNAAKKREISDLTQRLRALDKELQALAVGLVPADQLPQVLHDVLSNTERLKLLGMQTLPVEKLAITEGAADNSAASAEQQVDVYRHSVEVKVAGGYFVVANYLRELEALDWRFYWDKLDYKIDRYPNAIATIEVYTLSAGEGLLGE